LLGLLTAWPLFAAPVPETSSTPSTPIPSVHLAELQSSDVPAVMTSVVADTIAAELARSGLVRLVDRRHLDQVLAEQQLQVQGLTEPGSPGARPGRLVGADLLLSGSLARSGGHIALSLACTDTSTGVKRASFQKVVPDDLAQLISTSKVLAYLVLDLPLPGELHQFALAHDLLPMGRGALFVNTTPPGATIFLDDLQLDGTSPTGRSTVPVGRHRLRAVLDGFAPLLRDLDIRRDELARVELEFRTPGRLTLRSTPAQASVYLGERLLGTTPLENFQLEPGVHELRLARTGCFDLVRTVTLEEDKEAVLDLTLAHRTGTITVATIPPGEVWIDGERMPTERCADLTLAEGEHLLLVQHLDYRPLKRTIEIRSDEHLVITDPLIPLPAILHLSSTPSRASVSLDGTYLGTTPLTRSNLPAGRHQLTVYRKNFEELRQSVLLAPNEERRLDLRLLPDSRHLRSRLETSKTMAILAGSVGGAVLAYAGIALYRRDQAAGEAGEAYTDYSFAVVQQDMDQAFETYRNRRHTAERQLLQAIIAATTGTILGSVAFYYYLDVRETRTLLQGPGGTGAELGSTGLTFTLGGW